MRNDAKVAVPLDRDGADPLLQRCRSGLFRARDRVARPSRPLGIKDAARLPEGRPEGGRPSGPKGLSRRCLEGLESEERPGGSNVRRRDDHLVYHVRLASKTSWLHQRDPNCQRHITGEEKLDVFRGPGRGRKWDHARSRVVRKSGTSADDPRPRHSQPRDAGTKPERNGRSICPNMHPVSITY